MVMRRVEGWPLKLSAFLRGRNSVPFLYGSNDCMMMLADVVMLLTEFDPATAYRGTYSTEEEAAEILEAQGGMQNFITNQLGVEPTENVLTAHRGDAAMMPTPYGPMAGVVDDSASRIAVPLSDQLTLVRFPLTKATFIWRY